MNGKHELKDFAYKTDAIVNIAFKYVNRMYKY